MLLCKPYTRESNPQQHNRGLKQQEVDETRIGINEETFVCISRLLVNWP